MSCEVYDIRENKWSFISSYNSLLANSLYSFSSSIAVAGGGQAIIMPPAPTAGGMQATSIGSVAGGGEGSGI